MLVSGVFIAVKAVIYSWSYSAFEEKILFDFKVQTVGQCQRAAGGPGYLQLREANDWHGHFYQHTLKYGD